MSPYFNALRLWRAAAIGLLLVQASVAWGGEPTPAPSAPAVPSKEAREQMAGLHERMAACLRSERPFAECRSEMQQSCRTLLSGQGCPMMGIGMRGGWMNRPQQPQQSPPPQQ